MNATESDISLTATLQSLRNRISSTVNYTLNIKSAEVTIFGHKFRVNYPKLIYYPN